ncbi:MAG TPA: TIGR00153 family protein [Myxococcales bacterium]|nr:TIGR00153 family protein [Myxococcales bacterium]HIM00078.1 TIGR00153 family protein [Myxococcales bacterium]
MAWMDKLVGRSPVGPMQEHMRVVVACAHEIVPLVEAMASGDAAAVRERRAAIDDLEHEADSIKNEIRNNLPRRLMLALERRDMLEILDSQDSIADVTQDIAELVDQRGMVLPPPLVEPMTALAARVVAACDQGQKVINELDELVETGFSPRETARVETMISELGRIESETDELQDRACRVLFSLEDELGVATVYWHQIILWIADLADYAERVGNRLRLLIAN